MITRITSLCFVFAFLLYVRAEDPAFFTGKDLSGWAEPHGAWSVVSAVSVDPANPKAFVAQPGEGVLLNIAAGRTVNLLTSAEYGDCQIHVEFCVPKDSNSGVYVMGRYEVQILDSFGKANFGEHDCGAIYQRWKDGKGFDGHAPKVNASKAPGEWQTFEITFVAPRFNAAGEKTANGKFLKVVHNGQLVQENVEVTGPTRSAHFENEAATGPIMLQGDHGPVAFRNLRIAALQAK